MESLTAETLQQTTASPTTAGGMVVNVRYLQQRLAEHAQDSQYRFRQLHHWLWRKECILAALEMVLDNKGAHTPGVDGITARDMETAEARWKFVNAVHHELKTNTYRPSPVRRVEIPKPGQPGQMRPLGIPTIKDRVVQALLKMILEPIYESTFHDCSYGFRPNRSTMDAIVQVYRRSANPQYRQLWYIEGDLKACFDTIPHAKLLAVMRKHILDEKVLQLIAAQLAAGVIDLSGAWQATETGTPQGGVASPLLANVYLHYALDEWWWQRYGQLSKTEKTKRRKAGKGNPVLTRYADDFLLSTNGPKAEAIELKAELQAHLREWGLILSPEKTLITHLNDGLVFLGFYARRYRKGKRRVVLIRPSKKNIQRYKDRVRDILDRRHYSQSETTTLVALNRLTRGWGNYYRHVNASQDFHRLDWFLVSRTSQWLRRRHKYLAAKTYRQRFTSGNMRNIRVKVGDDKVRLFHPTDIEVKRYPRGWRRITNAFLDGRVNISTLEPPNYDPVGQGPHLNRWNGQENRAGQYDKKLRQEAKDQHRCTQCGRPKAEVSLQYHHDPAWSESTRHQGTTLCAECHAKATAAQRTAKQQTQNNLTSKSRMR